MAPAILARQTAFVDVCEAAAEASSEPEVLLLLDGLLSNDLPTRTTCLEGLAVRARVYNPPGISPRVRGLQLTSEGASHGTTPPNSMFRGRPRPRPCT